MSVQKFQQQLLREIKRSPKKAALLGLLAVAASYFWAPLVCGWFSSAETAQENPVAATPTSRTPANANQSAANSQGVATAVQHTWQEVLRWMEQDPRRKSANEAGLTRDPFAVEQPDPKKDPLQTAKTETKPVATPQELGLKLGGTLVGRQAVAWINGRPYAKGDKVKAADQLEFMVEEIATRRVTLKGTGQTFVLNMESPDTESLQITRVGEW